MREARHLVRVECCLSKLLSGQVCPPPPPPPPPPPFFFRLKTKWCCVLALTDCMRGFLLARRRTEIGSSAILVDTANSCQVARDGLTVHDEGTVDDLIVTPRLWYVELSHRRLVTLPPDA